METVFIIFGIVAFVIALVLVFGKPRGRGWRHKDNS